MKLFCIILTVFPICNSSLPRILGNCHSFPSQIYFVCFHNLCWWQLEDTHKCLSEEYKNIKRVRLYEKYIDSGREETWQ